MEAVGIRDLKARLSLHLQRVRDGATIVVTDRGREVATISPVNANANTDWACAMVREGRAHWNGGKPSGSRTRVRLKGGATVSDAVLEDRGVTLYLDTSSLLKLYVEEPGSQDVVDLVDSADIVTTSTIAYTEARAALARRRREGVLSARGLADVRRQLDAEWPPLVHVGVTPALCAPAADLAERYRLRTYDSVHLAAFADVARRAGVAHARFSSADRVLNRAAKALARTL